MFERMEMAETIYKCVLKTSYKKKILDNILTVLFTDVKWDE